MSSRVKLITAEVSFGFVLILIVLYFFVVAPAVQRSARLTRSGGSTSQASFKTGDDNEGYLSELAQFFAGLLFAGKGSRISESDLNLMKLQADRFVAGGGKVVKPGGSGGSGGSGGGSGGGGSGSGGGYGRGDVVSYSVTGVSKSGDSATVYGTATMKDGNTVSGAVYMRKINGKWETVGYSM